MSFKLFWEIHPWRLEIGVPKAIGRNLEIGFVKFPTSKLSHVPRLPMNGQATNVNL